MLAANSTPLPQACGARRTPCAEVSAAMRRISVKPPARATSGCAISIARRSSRSWKSNRVNSRSPEAMGMIVERLELPGKLDGGRDFQRAVRVDHQFDIGSKTAAGRLHPAHAVGDRESITADNAHLGGGEALGRVAREFRLRLIARRPAAAGIATY